MRYFKRISTPDAQLGAPPRHAGTDPVMPQRRLLQDCQGNVAPLFALGLAVLVGAVGAALDYSRASAARTAILSALDAAGLMLAKEAQTLSPAELSQKATDYFHANLSNSAAKDVQVTPELTNPQPGTFLLKLAATGTLEGTLTRVFGQSQLNLDASADVTWGIKKLELALVLDNTGSMAQSGKLAALKTAAHNLLSTLQAAAKQPGDVKVAIVPFDTTVNIGTGYAGQFWIDYSVKGIQPNKWKGCVIDRDQSNDVLDTAPSASNHHTLYPAANCGSLTSAMPLSSDWSALNTKIDAMTASGNTNITIGMAWGWHALTANLPFPEAAAPAPDLDKVIVMLTDGDNTQNRWSTSSSSIDARTSTVCANVKAANIRVYTVRVIDGNAALLKGCASKPEMYYDVQQADQLNTVFKSIAQQLATLRVSK
jgi:Flp pilus assembly protein TadG